MNKFKIGNVVMIVEDHFKYGYKNKIGIITNITTYYQQTNIPLKDIPLFVVQFYKYGKFLGVGIFRECNMRLATQKESEEFLDKIEKQEARVIARAL